MEWIIWTIPALIVGFYWGLRRFIESAIGEIPARLHEKQLEETRHKNELSLEQQRNLYTRDLQVENFFREISGAKLEEILDSWLLVLTDANRVTDPEQIRTMQKLLMLYGSDESIRRAAIFQQYTYIHSGTDNFNFATLYYLVAYLIVQIKKDFTGYDINPDDLIKMKISDISTEENQVKFNKAKEEAKQLLEI